MSQVSLLPTEKLDFWNRLNALSYKKNLSVVKVGDVPSLQQDGVLTFTIPGIAATITAKAVRVEYEAEKQYIWQGRIDQAGYMSIVSTDDGMSGFIQLNNKYFVLYPLYKSYCALFEYDMAAMPADTCLTSTVPTTALQSASSSIDYCAEDDNCSSIIDVLVLVTPEARTWIGGTFGNNWLNALAYVINGAETVNLAFANSDINARVRTRYAALNNFIYSGDTSILSDIFNLKNHTTAKSLRNQYRADLVIMLTDNRYGDVLGIVSEIGPDTYNYDDAYGIVTINNLLNPRFTYAHEVGHLFGARHNTNDNCECDGGDNTDICAHGWRFDDANGIERRTLLARLGNTEQRLLHYSNPDINFNATPTGDADNDNAHMIQNTSCALDGYRSDPSFKATMSGITQWCRPGHPTTEPPITFSAVITPTTPGFPGIPPYSYEWRWNLSGIFNAANPGTLLGTGSSITLNEPLFCPSFFLRLRVTCADGVVSNSTLQINTDLCEVGCGGAGKSSSSMFESSNKSLSFQIIPNPANTSFSVLNAYLDAGKYQLQLVDAFGKIVDNRSLTIEEPTAPMQQHYSTEHLPAGIYYLNWVGNGSSQHQKIIITH
ncbi:MAG: zinc-dependent metalloprotease [Chitinophagales bacterium]|nr:zinc-dependent metalloprotease [Chitinophagales bacterium]